MQRFTFNDRKSVFTEERTKEYLKTIPADNLMKIEVIHKSF